MVRGKRGKFSFQNNVYPFKVSVNHPEAMHIRQPVRDVNQLKRTSVRLCGGGDQGTTHKLSAVYMSIFLDELVDVPVIHPLRNHRKPAFAYRYSKQW
jgi:hypothetical protein